MYPFTVHQNHVPRCSNIQLISPDAPHLTPNLLFCIRNLDEFFGKKKIYLPMGFGGFGDFEMEFGGEFSINKLVVFHQPEKYARQVGSFP